MESFTQPDTAKSPFPDYASLLASCDHRSYPLPFERPAMQMTWSNLLFAHWPVPTDAIRSLIPPGLELDLFDNTAWIGVVPFLMSNVRPRLLPPIPGTSVFPELNVRTYVTRQGKPGVYFFSLDAASQLVVRAARLWFHLPYYHAAMKCEVGVDETRYESHRRFAKLPAVFRAQYRPLQLAARDELARWLTERYCLYTTWRNRVYRGEIHHREWPLHHAEGDIERNTMTAPLGLHLPDEKPLLHFAQRLDVLAWALRPC